MKTDSEVIQEIEKRIVMIEDPKFTDDGSFQGTLVIKGVLTALEKAVVKRVYNAHKIFTQKDVGAYIRVRSKEDSIDLSASINNPRTLKNSDIEEGLKNYILFQTITNYWYLPFYVSYEFNIGSHDSSIEYTLIKFDIR